MMDAVGFDRREGVATVTLHRPPLNILDLATIEQLGQVLDRSSHDAEVRLVVIRGGDRAFSAGVAVEDHSSEKVEEMLRLFHGALRILLDMPAVTIAVVDGHCLGGGMELAAACDIIVATTRSTFGQPEIKLGCYPPFAAALYPGLLGTGTTVEMLLSGKTLSCDQAKEIGFVTHSATVDELDSLTAELITELTPHSRAVARIALRAIRQTRCKEFDQALEASEQLYLEELVKTEDMKEGVDAFLEKRRPEWKHR